MKERPILFSGPMVQTILDGRKTQTRRIMKPQPPVWINEWGFTCFTPNDCISGRGTYEDKGPGEKFFKMKYGDIGDRLWVRETWAIGISTGNSWHSEDGRIKTMVEPQRYQRRYAADETGGFFGKWRPSIFMPRWACRTVLEITEIRVQRVQEITEDDARAEGMIRSLDYGKAGINRSAVEAFMRLWDSINGAGSWAANPWVWCVSFKKVTV